MCDITILQNYWWLLISVLGAILVFLLFVQGGQSMLLCMREPMAQNLVVNLLGRKWELTFTTLVVFGGAFFASFPLFYSTSFGGAYWLWMLILFSFILQAVSYEFRRKRGNIYGTCTYDWFLFINGTVGCILLGVVVGTMIFGAEFTITKSNILDSGTPVISQWASTHGLEAIVAWRPLLLGVMVLFLARTIASIYILNGVQYEDSFTAKMRSHLMVNSGVFVVLFLAFAAILLTADGYRSINGNIEKVQYLYLKNFIDMWWAAILFVVGVVGVLAAIIGTIFIPKFRYGMWFIGCGTVLVVLTLFWVIGYNDTAYYPSIIDPQSSLTLANSSSSLFTLTVMSWVSIITPFVAAYIGYVWYKMDSKPVSSDEVSEDEHAY